MKTIEIRVIHSMGRGEFRVTENGIDVCASFKYTTDNDRLPSMLEAERGAKVKAFETATHHDSVNLSFDVF